MYQLGLGTYTPKKLYGGEPFTSSCPESRQDGLKISHLDTEVTGKGKKDTGGRQSKKRAAV